MQITLYNFSKKQNSTKQTSGGTSISATLKEDTSLMNPTFKVTSTAITPCNYVGYAGRFYFVSDIIKRNNNITELVCREDYLGTWKSEILASQQFVERSASAYNSTLKDSMYFSSDAIVQNISATQSITGWSTSGNYVLKIAGATNNAFIAFGTKAEVVALLDFMYTQGSFSDIMSDAFTRYLFDPLKYILNMMWFPIDSIPSSGPIPINLGYWPTGVNMNLVSDSLYDPTFTVTIPATTWYGDFRDYDDEFTKIILYLPCYGTYELPAEYIGKTVGAKYTVDFLTGQCNILIKIDNNIIADLACQIGVPVQLTQTAVDTAQQIQTGINAVGSIATGNIVGAVSSIESGIRGRFQPVVSTKSSAGNKSMTLSEMDIKATVIRHGTSGNPNLRNGRLYCENVALSSLSGYCKCINSSIDIGGTLQEKEAIENAMNNGFYIE